MKPCRLAAAVLCLWALGGPSRAQDLAQALGRDSELTLHLRSYYFDRRNPGDVTNAAWALGGWLGYRSGWIGDVLRLGVVGYTSQPLWAPLDKTGSGLLAPPDDGYSVIGESYVSLKLMEQVLTAGRFQVHQPEIHATDNRMTPITYSGGNLQGNLGQAGGYYAAYLNATKPKTSENFVNFVSAAGIDSGASEPLWLLGAQSPGEAPWRWHVSSYYVPNVLSSTYADSDWLLPLPDEWRLRLGAQAMAQRGVGSKLLADFSTWSAGLKADLQQRGATFRLAYQQTGSGYDYQTPYSGWAGYTYMIVKSFNLADQKAVLLGGRYDFGASGVPGLVVDGAVVHGWDAINATTRAPQPNWTEYDLTLDYRFTAAHWPAWARPLWLRGRAAYVDMRTDGNVQDYRLILNYAWQF
jgi:outer membrane porin, OprD family